MDFSKLTAPKYKGGSICNILPSLANIYSIKLKDKTSRIPLYPQFHRSLEKLALCSKRIVIFEIDGLGFDRLAKIRKRFNFFKKHVLKITSTFPTYTHSAFASFCTGTPPAVHGLVAGTFKIGKKLGWMREISEAKNLILTKSLLQDFEDSGLKVSSILYDVNDDNYSKQLYPNRIFVSTKNNAKNLFEEAQLVEERVFQKIHAFAKRNFFILTAYFWYLDGITGKYGKFSRGSIDHCVFLFEEISKLMSIFPKDTLFLFFGDHGHTSLRKNVLLNQNHLQEISSLSSSKLALDGRTLMFYTKNPYLTKKLFERHYARYAGEIPRKDYFELLGRKRSIEVKNRVGNLIYLAKPHYTLRLKPKKSKATHGGASREEMETVFGFWKN